MKVETQTLPATASQKELEKTTAKLFKLLEFTQNHLEQNDRIKSITIKDKDYTLTIKPNDKS